MATKSRPSYLWFGHPIVLAIIAFGCIAAAISLGFAIFDDGGKKLIWIRSFQVIAPVCALVTCFQAWKQRRRYRASKDRLGSRGE